MSGIFLDENSREKVIQKFNKISSVNEFVSLLNFIEKNNDNLKDKNAFKPINSKQYTIYPKQKTRDI